MKNFLNLIAGITAFYVTCIYCTALMIFNEKSVKEFPQCSIFISSLICGMVLYFIFYEKKD